jgi:hypothetical protein
LQFEIWHDPVEQVEVAFASLQVTPQALQFESVVRLVSQPLFGLPSQSPQPEAQVGVHLPELHVVEPLALVQARKQAPQLLVVLSAVSQPLAALLSQLPQPALQELSTQLPDEHEPLALAKEQALPHPPQWLTLVWVFVSQPLLLLPSQSP